MRIYSWNVNGVRAAAKKGLLKWMSEEDPDILCLQEIKCQESDLDQTMTAPFGYKSYWFSAEKKGYSGVALYSKKEPKNVQLGLGIKAFDSEGRTIVADYENFVLINCYFPNSRRDHSRLGYKLEFCQAITELCDSYTKKKKGILLCGDVNVAHKEIDLRNPKTNTDTAGFLPEERAWMESFLKKGYLDTFRIFNQDAGHYTWWSHRPGVRDRNIGWRIDYFLINGVIRPKLKKALIHPDVYGSDHCPVSIELSK